MGLNSSKPEIEEMISRFNVRCRDEANNLTYLIDRSNNKSYMLKELFANDEASIKNIESELVRKKQMHHEHVAQLKGTCHITQSITSTWASSSAAAYTHRERSIRFPSGPSRTSATIGYGAGCPSMRMSCGLFWLPPSWASHTYSATSSSTSRCGRQTSTCRTAAP